MSHKNFKIKNFEDDKVDHKNKNIASLENCMYSYNTVSS